MLAPAELPLEPKPLAEISPARIRAELKPYATANVGGPLLI